jgi:hypothetical protein
MGGRFLRVSQLQMKLNRVKLKRSRFIWYVCLECNNHFKKEEYWRVSSDHGDRILCRECAPEHVDAFNWFKDRKFV